MLPEMKSLNKSDLSASNKKLAQIKEQIKAIGRKALHCNQSIDSLHTKMNIWDSRQTQLSTDFEAVTRKVETCIRKFDGYQS